MKIICIGRNYADHAKELNNDIPEKPVLFLKPETALLPKNHPFYIPDFTNDLHFEVELVLKINRLGKHVQPEFAHRYFSEIGIGIDFTARDLQNQQKKKGLPWEIAKAFDFSAPVSQKFLPVSSFPNLKDINFRLEKNGEVVQKGNTGLMLFPFEQIIHQASSFFTLKIGDLIFTGTPAGVGQVNQGDTLEAFIENESLLKLTIH
jgi:acylpyruvate hydrolase